MTVSNATAVIPDHLKYQAPAEDRTARTDFLQLLVAQMEHQDPLQPQDGTEFMQQLATLTQVEQAATMSSQLDRLLEAQYAGQAASSAGDLLSMVGHTATVVTDTVQAPMAPGTQLFAKVPADATDVVAEVTDAEGKTRKIKLDATEGDQPIVFEPPLESGKYTVKITATVGDEADTELTAALRGVVTKLEKGDELTLILGGTSVLPDNILSVEL